MTCTRRPHRLNRLLGLLLAFAALLQACTSDRPVSSSDGTDGEDETAARLSGAGRLPEESGDPRTSPEGSSGGEGAGLLGYPDATAVLGAGLANADRTKRLVFLHSGASW